MGSTKFDLARYAKMTNITERLLLEEDETAYIEVQVKAAADKPPEVPAIKT